MEQGAKSWVPCLLHVYWSFHFAHLLLGSFALRAWWRTSDTTETGILVSNSGRLTDTWQVTGDRPPSTVYRLLPWICLGLLFWIPGVYLEFPADPWHHFSRVNEWSWLQTVTEHSYWKKSSYFLAYSLVGQIAPPVLQLKWFDVFYTGCCLLLCWQYYRLARALCLGARASVVFVLLQALLIGNNLIGFYRYYGMSSSLFAQLGAVALMRVALTALGKHHGSDGNEFSGQSILSWVLKSLAPGVLLLALTAFNHVQGLGIAGLGVAAVVVWRLIQWRHSMVWWLGGAAVLLSAGAVLWWPRHLSLDAIYRPAGWLTAWYGFNFISPSSPAFDRAMVILGLFGLINLLAGMVLLRRNHLTGWLTVLPGLALCLPCVAIPFANSLAAEASLEGGDIIVFHRMLLAIPSGLALVALLTGREQKAIDWAEAPPVQARGPVGFPIRTMVKQLPAANRLLALSFVLLLLGLFALVVVPASARYYNRLFSILMVPANDLAMEHVMRSVTAESLAMKPRLSALSENPEQVLRERGSILTSPGIGYALNATGATLLAGTRKWMIWPTDTPPSLTATTALENLRHIEPGQAEATPFPPLTSLFSPSSQTGYLSTHWLSNEVALEHAAQGELFTPQAVTDAKPRLPQIWLEWFSPRDHQQFMATGYQVSVASRATEERGRLDSGTGNQLIQAEDLLSLRPVMRTLDGNGWLLGVTITGPGFYAQREFAGRPSPLGGENWIIGDHQIRIRQPGRYTVTLSGKVCWPGQTFFARYYFDVQPRRLQTTSLP